jgi:hypothetical protein
MPMADEESIDSSSPVLAAYPADTNIRIKADTINAHIFFITISQIWYLITQL